jgi:hypothetical protein
MAPIGANLGEEICPTNTAASAARHLHAFRYSGSTDNDDATVYQVEVVVAVEGDEIHKAPIDHNRRGVPIKFGLAPSNLQNDIWKLAVVSSLQLSCHCSAVLPANLQVIATQ